MRTDSPAAAPPVRIAVSACLLGERVRYDGDHSRDDFVTEGLGRCFELIPDCPEVGIGLGTPRPKIHLAEAERGGIRLLDEQGNDLTAKMSAYAGAAARRFVEQGVAGIVLKSKSPSCGIGDTRVALPPGAAGSGGPAGSRGPAGRNGRAGGSGEAGRALERRDGTGLFAAGLAAARPRVPTISEAGLADPVRRDHWLTRVFAAAEFRQLRDRGPDARTLRAFAGRWREEIAAVSEAAAEQWLREAAGGRRAAAGEILDRLETILSEALAGPPTAAGHRRVLEGYARRLGPAARSPKDPMKDPTARRGSRAVLAAIAAFARGQAPLAVPIGEIAARAARSSDPALRDHAYLAPRPPRLGYRETIYPP